jgi:hypothetical protein
MIYCPQCDSYLMEANTFRKVDGGVHECLRDIPSPCDGTPHASHGYGCWGKVSKVVADVADAYNSAEQDEIIAIFSEMLREVTRDGGRKRASGAKKCWKEDEHRKAIFSHLGKWAVGELVDECSGVHPLVHTAWRCLAVAWQEMNHEKNP